MRIFAIGDLHLSLSEGTQKPMDIFGPEWVNHAERTRKSWMETVREEDLVILAGDHSWALKLEEAREDLEWISSLPGKKVLVKGNHDLWWSSINKLSGQYPDLFFIQNNCYMEGKLAICGTRGWICPGDRDYTAHDDKIYKREIMRLKASLDAAVAAGAEEIIGALHFPPTNDKQQRSGFTECFSQYGVKMVVYGHLHGKDAYTKGIESNLNGTEYRLVSLDRLQCRPLLIRE